MFLDVLAWMGYFLPLFYLAYIWGRVSAYAQISAFEAGFVMALVSLGYFLVFFPMMLEFLS